MISYSSLAKMAQCWKPDCETRLQQARVMPSFGETQHPNHLEALLFRQPAERCYIPGWEDPTGVGGAHAHSYIYIHPGTGVTWPEVGCSFFRLCVFHTLHTVNYQLYLVPGIAMYLDAQRNSLTGPLITALMLPPSDTAVSNKRRARDRDLAWAITALRRGASGSRVCTEAGCWGVSRESFLLLPTGAPSCRYSKRGNDDDGADGDDEDDDECRGGGKGGGTTSTTVLP